MLCGTVTFSSRDDNPAGSGLGEFAGGEAPDDDLLAFDPVSVLGVLEVEVRADDGGNTALHANV